MDIKSILPFSPFILPLECLWPFTNEFCNLPDRLQILSSVAFSICKVLCCRVRPSSLSFSSRTISWFTLEMLCSTTRRLEPSCETRSLISNNWSWIIFCATCRRWVVGWKFISFWTCIIGWYSMLHTLSPDRLVPGHCLSYWFLPYHPPRTGTDHLWLQVFSPAHQAFVAWFSYRYEAPSICRH